MPTPTELQQLFPVPGVTIDSGQGGLTRVVVDTAAATGEVYLQGAHVTQYQPEGQSPALFMSSKSLFAAGKAIRGGVPLIFPWFGAKADNPKAPQHGFARSQEWAVRDVKAGTAGAVDVVLALTPNDATRAAWPFEFELLYTVKFGPALEMALEVRNTGPTGTGSFSFEEALHTYLAVSDVRRATIEGLAGRQFIDKVDGFKRKAQGPGAFTLDGETDRVYLATPDTVVVRDGGRTLEVSKQNSQATVVWNPWAAKAKAMADFGDDEWPGMICVETANAADHAVTLEPGQGHMMRGSINHR